MPVRTPFPGSLTRFQQTDKLIWFAVWKSKVTQKFGGTAPTSAFLLAHIKLMKHHEYRNMFKQLIRRMLPKKSEEKLIGQKFGHTFPFNWMGKCVWLVLYTVGRNTNYSYAALTLFHKFSLLRLACYCLSESKCKKKYLLHQVSDFDTSELTLLGLFFSTTPSLSASTSREISVWQTLWVYHCVPLHEQYIPDSERSITIYCMCMRINWMFQLNISRAWILTHINTLLMPYWYYVGKFSDSELKGETNNWLL